MKVLVCGSREIDSQAVVKNAITESPWNTETIVTGHAEGVDSCAELYAARNGADIETHPVPEWVWEQVGSKVGPMRNSYMIDQVEAVIAVWDGESPGTKDAIRQAESEGLPVFIAHCETKGDTWYVDEHEYRENDQSVLTEFEQ